MSEAAEAQALRAAFQQALDLHMKARYAEAEAILRGAFGSAAPSADLWNLRGVNFRLMRRNHEAVWCFRHALALAPKRSGVWSNLGNALKDLKHTESAVACQRRALALSPESAVPHYNLALALVAANRHREALAAFDRAHALKPDDGMVRWDRARALLHLGDYARGWPEYEARFLTGQLPKRALPGRPWNGGRYDGKRLLLVSEQGYGDAIWIARYLRRVKALGGELIMECRPPLIPLFQSMQTVDRLVAQADPLPDADFHLYQCSLPGLFTKSLAEVPPAPYLQADAGRLAKFAPLLERVKGKLRIGIVWSGSTTFVAQHDRAVSLPLFLEWLALPGVALFSLQKGPPEAELRTLPAGAPIVDLAPLIEDFADTAAAIAQLDLVIMTDSAVAHLTGALGKPVWVLLNFVPHWLWLGERNDSPWYPSMRFFRQRAWGDWTGVFDQAAAALMRLFDLAAAGAAEAARGRPRLES